MSASSSLSTGYERVQTLDDGRGTSNERRARIDRDRTARNSRHVRPIDVDGVHGDEPVGFETGGDGNVVDRTVEEGAVEVAERDGSARLNGVDGGIV